MSINNRALSVLRNVKDVLSGQFGDVDLVSLSYVSAGVRYNFERAALMLETVAPMLEKFGHVVHESSGYVRRQQASARRFRAIVILIIIVVVFGCMMIMHGYSRNPGPWNTRAVYYLGVGASCIFVILFMRLLMLTVDDRSRQVAGVSATDLDGYRMNLSENIFIKFVNARLRGPEAVKSYRSDMVQQMQRDFDETNQFDFCSQQKDSKQMLSDTCMVLNPCTTTSTALQDSVAEVLRRHFSGGSGTPCARILGQLFRALQDVRDGTKVSQLDQFFLWTQITRGVETLRALMSWDTASQADLSLSSTKLLDIVKKDVVETLKLDLTEIANLAVYTDASSKPLQPHENVALVADKAACWKECYGRGDACKWATFDGQKCTIGTRDLVPGKVSSVFQYRRPPPGQVDNVDTSGVLVRAGRGGGGSGGGSDGDDGGMADAFVCNDGIAADTLQSATPLVYSGSLTLDVCAQGSDCDMVKFDDGGDLRKLTAASMTGYTVSDGQTYRVAFADGKTAAVKAATTEKFCRKTTPVDLVDDNPERVVQTYIELEPALRERIMFSMENYNFKVPLGAYRAYILKQLQAFYGAATFISISPHLLDTLTQLETAVADARAAAQRERRYVTLQRFRNRLTSMSAAQRTALSAVASDMARAAYLHDRYFKPVPDDLDLRLYLSVIVFGILLMLVSVTILIVTQIACLRDQACKPWSAVRTTAVVMCFVTVFLTLILTAYRKATVKRQYNTQVADTNGRALVAKTSEFVALLTGAGRFTVNVAIQTKDGATVFLQQPLTEADNSATVTQRGDSITLEQKNALMARSMTPDIETSANLLLENLVVRPDDAAKVAGKELRSVRVTLLTPSQGSTAAGGLKIRTLRVGDVSGGIAYTFGMSQTTVLGGSTTTAVLPVRQRQSFYKAKDKGTTYDLQVFTSENVSDFGAVYLVGRGVVETFDKCNSLTQAMRELPFPVMDMVVMIALIAVVVALMMYLMGAIRPMEKVKNVRSLYEVRKKIKLGEAAPEFDSLITCCKTPQTVWDRLLNTSIIILVAFSVYAAYALNNTTADYKGGLYSSSEYADNKCV